MNNNKNLNHYYLTIEKTYRIGVEFDAENDSVACDIANEKAHEIINSTVIFNGDIETDYCLCDENQKAIIDWT